MSRSAVVVALVVLSLLVAPTALAKSTLTVGALGLLSQNVAVELETDVAAWSKQMTFVLRGVFRKGGADGGAGVRYYVDGASHHGLYFGGYGMLTGLKSAPDGGVGGTIGLMGVAGYKWQLDNGLVVDVGAAMGSPAPSSSLHVGVGIAF